jgi:polyisoprenoid-binding protein YceI
MTETTTTATSSPDRPVRVVDGVELPVAGTWTIDPGHTEVGFTGRHFMLTRVRGRFTDVSGTVTVGDDPRDTTVDVTIGVASVSSGDDTRDEHLRSADLFDVATHPTATFRSTAVRWEGDGRTGALTGDLTIKGTTRPVTLRVEYLGQVQDPWGNERIVFSASGRVSREDWGITWNMPLAAGGVLVSRDIDLHLEVEAVLGA